MQIETVACDNWQSFKAKILNRLYGDEPFERGRFLFRGQRDAAWRLESSYDRWFRDLKTGESHRIPMAEQMLKEFSRQSEGLQKAGMADERLATLALAQHYGLPTRVLDWSESPYIAAFFAFAESLEKVPPGGRVAVFALNTKSYVWSGRGVTLLHLPPGSNMRLRNQDGRFTLLESQANALEDHISLLPNEQPWPLYRFEIPVGEARHALSELDIMGVNATHVYPDLTGCALSAKICVLLKRT